MDFRKYIFLTERLRNRRQVYLDHNATTRVSGPVRRTMSSVLKKNFGNPSAQYRIGRQSAEILEQSRQHVATAIQAHPGEVCFTGCATESNNAVLKSVSDHFFPARRKIVSTPIEHPSVIKTLEYLKTRGIEVVYCQVDHQGRVIMPELEMLIDEDTFLVCCAVANAELGTIQDIRSVVRFARKHHALVLSDCVQAVGKIPIHLHDWGVDYASFSAHKLHGPKGVGALYVREGSPFSPFIHGGHQEDGMRAGTEAIHNIAGLGAAFQGVPKLLTGCEKIEKLKRRFIEQISGIRPDCVINSPESGCLPNTLSISFPGTNNSELMGMLDYHGIAVSTGSACSAGDHKPSPILKAIGLSDESAMETIRISLGYKTNWRDLRYTVRVLKKYFEGRIQYVNQLTAGELHGILLSNEQAFLVDVRPAYMRRRFQSIADSLEASFVSLRKFLDKLPRDKHIVVVCQRGNLSYGAAYFLKSKGFKNVSSLQNGIMGWYARSDSSGQN